jgi:hypothetical protein
MGRWLWSAAILAALDVADEVVLCGRGMVDPIQSGAEHAHSKEPSLRTWRDGAATGATVGS